MDTKSHVQFKLEVNEFRRQRWNNCNYLQSTYRLSKLAAWVGWLGGGRGDEGETGAKPPRKCWERACTLAQNTFLESFEHLRKHLLLLLRSLISISCLPCHFDRSVKFFYWSPPPGKKFFREHPLLLLRKRKHDPVFAILEMERWRLCDSDSSSENSFKSANL